MEVQEQLEQQYVMVGGPCADGVGDVMMLMVAVPSRVCRLATAGHHARITAPTNKVRLQHPMCQRPRAPHPTEDSTQ